LTSLAMSSSSSMTNTWRVMRSPFQDEFAPDNYSSLMFRCARGCGKRLGVQVTVAEIRAIRSRDQLLNGS
jgi:hypothetical protein